MTRRCDKKKYIQNVYMREVNDKLYYEEEDKSLNGYVALTFIKNIDKPLTTYCNGKKYIGLDKGSSILEYVPKNGNYNCRVFFNENNQPLCFYFDINNGTGRDEQGVWYDDLYLDVTMECPTITGGFYYIRLDDEKEFKQAKKDSLINDELYNMGYETANKLMEELKIFKNDIVNRCQVDLIMLKNKLSI